MNEADVLAAFPETQFAMAYGSAVFKQSGYASHETPMLDLVFAVDDPVQWHAENMRRNANHYTVWAPLIGARGVCAIQDSAARVYYNVQWPSLKYGVMSTQRLLADLRSWETLFVAGRMHKPVLCMRHNEAVALAARENLRSAFCAALLMVGERFTDIELFTGIAGLSYAGDVRFRIGFENPNKVRNLVLPHVASFRALYAPFFAEYVRGNDAAPQPPQMFPWTAASSSDASSTHLAPPVVDSSAPLQLQQDMSAGARGRLFAALPASVRNSMRRLSPHVDGDASDAALLAALDGRAGATRAAVLHGVSALVGPTSFWQSLKGNLTSRPTTNVRYMWQKFQKSLRK